MLHLLLKYLYPVMLPLSLIEGPMVSIAAGAGVAAGKVNPLLAGLIIAFGAAFQDTVYYWVGRLAQDRPGVRRLAERTRLLHETVLPLEKAWRRNMVGTLAASKFAYGLYGPILVTAGMARVRFWPYLAASLAMSAVILAAWFGFGFVLERLYGVAGHSWVAGAAEGGIGAAGLIGLFLIGRHARKRLQIEQARKKRKGVTQRKSRQ